MKTTKTPAPEGYYEDDADDLQVLEEETTSLRARLRQRVMAILGTSYGISALVHVAMLLILASIVIARRPDDPKDARLIVRPPQVVEEYPEATPDVKDQLEVPLETEAETP